MLSRGLAGAIFPASCVAGALATLAILSCEPAVAEMVYPGTTWATRTPAEVGLDQAKLDQFASNVGGVGCIVKDGYMVKTWGTQSSKADWASAMKPVMSTMLMFAVKEGKLNSVDDLVRPLVQQIFIGKDLIAKDRTMTFRHLANMVSGYALPENPGAAWGYNDYAINLYLKTLFDGVFQQSPNEAATAANRLGALQFQDGSVFSSRFGYGLSTTPRDFARIGWFWLNKGNWNGTQLLPTSYFDGFMKPGVPGNLPRTAGGSNDYLNVYFTGGGTDQTEYGPGIYGFNWWFNAKVGTTNNLTWPDAPADTFQANGHWNKEVMTIIPSLNMAVAARGNWGSFEPGNSGSGMNQNLKLLKEAIVESPPGPMTGQIVVDPDHPEWLKYHGGGPHFMCGPGDPEGFLYRGTRNADGTRTGDQMTLINKVNGTGANCIYFQAVRSHGGDGVATHNPFIDSDPSKALDQDILNQWETWFTAMDNAGIVIYFFFYDDGSRIWNTGDTVGSAEKAFIQALVNKFEHHKHLIWCVAEESGEAYTSARVRNIAAEIKTADDHDHVIADHLNSGVVFTPYQDGCALTQFAIQYNVSTASALHSGVVTAWSNAAGRYNLNMSEAASYGTGSTGRKKDWACAMGGAYVMRLGMNIDTTPIGDLEDCGRVVSFFESTNFNEMAPHDELKHGGTEYVLAEPGDSYIAYASSLSGDIGLKGMSASTYDFKWFDCVTGNVVDQTDVSVSAGDQTWSKPGDIGQELAVWVRLTGGTVNRAPTANPQNVTCFQDQSADITLTGSDPDVDPLTYVITAGPSHGTLTDDDGDDFVRYTAEAGYTGADSFSFKVNDGSLDSVEAAVSITVESAGNDAPVAEDSSVSTAEGASVYCQLVYTDPDGPGPFTVTIVTQPSNGTLTGTGNDRTYTPNAGYTGPDSFTWKVNDGELDSNVATVSITVEETPPAAPSGLAATAVSSSRIDLAWTDNSSNETGFRIERAEGAGAVTVTLKTYNGIATAPTIEEAGTANSFKVGGKVVNDRLDTWTQVPGALDGATRLLTARSDRTQEPVAGKYVVTVSPCTIYLPLDPRYGGAKLSWMDGSWTDSGLTCNSSAQSGWKIWKKDIAAAGDVTLGCDENTYDGMCYVFVGGAGWAEIATVGADVESCSDTGLSAGTTYTYRVRAYNGSGDSEYSNQDSATTLGGPPVNRPPVADAGPDQSVSDADGDGSESVALDGSGSSDPDGTIASHEWDFDYDGVTFDVQATGVTPAWTYSTPGTYTAALRVTDNEGAIDVDTVTISVYDATDSDSDGLPDSWELDYFSDVADCVPGEDSDEDGLTNAEEYALGTNPVDRDTDDDGYSDGEEDQAGTDPSDPASFPAGSPTISGVGCTPSGASGLFGLFIAAILVRLGRRKAR